MILTEIGEIGVTLGEGREFVLRPSLFAMTQIGTPHEVVELFVRVMSDAQGTAAIERQFSDALCVLYCCAQNGEDVADAFGSFYTEDGEQHYEPGLAPRSNVLILARCLLKHGMVGVEPETQKPPENKESEYSNVFDARTFVSMGMAHLGLNEREAWSMTMTGLLGALRAKFPPQQSNAPGARAPTREEHEATMDWFEKVEAKRKAKQGAH